MSIQIPIFIPISRYSNSHISKSIFGNGQIENRNWRVSMILNTDSRSQIYNWKTGFDRVAPPYLRVSLCLWTDWPVSMIKILLAPPHLISKSLILSQSPTLVTFLTNTSLTLVHWQTTRWHKCILQQQHNSQIAKSMIGNVMLTVYMATLTCSHDLQLWPTDLQTCIDS